MIKTHREGPWTDKLIALRGEIPKLDLTSLNQSHPIAEVLQRVYSAEELARIAEACLLMGEFSRPAIERALQLNLFEDDIRATLTHLLDVQDALNQGAQDQGALP